MLATYPEEEACDPKTLLPASDEGRREADREGRKDGLELGRGFEDGEFIIKQDSSEIVWIASGCKEGDGHDGVGCDGC
jgi:hypothetical protein